MNETTPLVVIFGMHRSGTSYVAQVLNSVGFNLGDDVLRGGESDNLCGHWESQSVIEINDAILGVSGGSWCNPPSRLLSAVTTGVSIDRLSNWMSRRRPAALKDPRMTLTFPLWRDRLGPYQIIACLRHPMAVARSLQVRQGWPLSRGLALWVEYNRRLLDCLRTEPGAFLFDFDADTAWIEGWFKKCFQKLGVSDEISALRTWNPLLRHHAGTEPISDPTARALYEQLKTRCYQQDVALKPAPENDRLQALSSVAPSQTETPGGQCDEANPQLVNDLAEVYRRHNLVIQQIDQRFHAAEGKRTSHYEQHKSELRDLERWTRECYERLATEVANEHTRSTAAYAGLNQIVADQETIVDRIAYLNLRCDENHRMFVTKFNEFSHVLHEFSEHLTACEQAFAELNNWVPLRMWRKLRRALKSTKAKLRSLRSSSPQPPPAHTTPAPHWRDREPSTQEQEAPQRAS